MTNALINKDILRWAMSRADVSGELLAKRLSVKADLVAAWLDGSAHPSFPQAQKAASVLSVPFGYFYLTEPPREELPVPEFRTVESLKGSVDVDTFALVSDIVFKRDWFKEYREQIGFEHLPFVGSISLRTPIGEAASRIAEVIHGPAGRPRTGNWEDFLQQLMDRAEEAGIWVMRTGIVGNNTHRPLAVSRFRGLSIADGIVPLLLLNGQDSKAAQIFTFAHELAHIWLGVSGVSNVKLDEHNFGSYAEIERFCNAVAGEFLTPTDEFKRCWRKDIDLDSQVDSLTTIFKVSRVVVARRAYDLGFVDSDDYSHFYAVEKRRWEDIAKKRSSGGNHWNTLPVRNGKAFTRSVVSEAVRGGLLFRQAASLLGISPSKVRDLYVQMQA